MGVYLWFKILRQKVANLIKPDKKDCSFCNTISLKKSHLFSKPLLTQHFKKYTPAALPKIHSFYMFSSKHVSGWCQKDICTAPFLEAQELHSRSTWKASISIFLHVFVRKCLFQSRKGSFYLIGGWIFYLSPPLCYSPKIASYGMIEKKISFVYMTVSAYQVNQRG